jgi:hypothetical protein
LKEQLSAAQKEKCGRGKPKEHQPRITNTQRHISRDFNLKCTSICIDLPASCFSADAPPTDEISAASTSAAASSTAKAAAVLCSPLYAPFALDALVTVLI